MDTIVYLIRHSEQFRGYKEKYNSQQQNEKIVLSINGERLAEELSNNAELQNIDELWSSSYSRAVCTAKYIAEKNNLEINVISDFGEKQFLDGNYNVIENDCLNQYIKDYIPNFNKENLENYLKKFVLKSNYE